MLFDKILFMCEKAMSKREKDVTRKTNEQLVKNKDSLMYENYISDIKKLYPVKLRETHKRHNVALE